MIDTHTHIYLQEFDEDRRAVIDRAEKSGITRMILPNVDVETVGALRQTLNDCSSLCKGAMGINVRYTTNFLICVILFCSNP